MTEPTADQRRLANQLYEEACADFDAQCWHEAIYKLDRVLDVVPDYPGAAARRREAYRWHQINSTIELALTQMRAGQWRAALWTLRHVQALVGNYKNTRLLIRIAERRLQEELQPARAARPLAIDAAALAPNMRMAIIGAAALIVGLIFGNILGELNIFGTSEIVLVVPTATPIVVGMNESTATLASPTGEASPSSEPAPSSEPSTTVESAASTTPEATAPADSQSTLIPAPPVTIVATRATVVTSTAPRTQTTRPTATRTASAATAAPTRTPLPNPATATTVASVSTPTAASSAAPPTQPPSTSQPTAVVLLTAETPPSMPSRLPTPRPVGVTATDFKFDPTELSLTAGERIRLTLVNKGAVEHTWLLANSLTNALVVKIEAPAGQTVSKEFTAPGVGNYNFVCDVPGHAELGMSGRAIVR